MKDLIKKYTLGLYEKAVPAGLELGQKLEFIARCGFDFMELSIDESAEKQERLTWSRRKRAEFAKLSRSVLPVTSICFSMQRSYPFGSSDPEVRRRAVEAMDQAIGFAYDTGIRIIQLAGYDVYYEPSTPETRRYFLENLRLAAERASSYGVILGLETMENDFMNTVKKAMKYVKAVNSAYLGVYPDVGNISNALPDASAVTEDILSGRGHIFSAHLKETRPGVYRNLMFGEGQVDFVSALNAFKAAGVSRFNAEFWYGGGDPAAELEAARSFLKEKLDTVFAD